MAESTTFVYNEAAKEDVGNKGDSDAVEKDAVKEVVTSEVGSNGNAPSEDKANDQNKEGAQSDQTGEDGPTEESMTEAKRLKAKPRIVRQVEYYFGDMNLFKDRFLKEQIQLDDGWVPMDKMMKFKRLKSITSSWGLITCALKEGSELMEVSECGMKVRRKPDRPIPPDSKERREDITARTVYAKRFPLDARLDDMMDYFETFGPVDNVFMKKDFHKHTFKGSVFVTYRRKEDGEKFLNEEESKYNDVVLEAKMWKVDYFKKKPNKKESVAQKRKSEGGTEGEPQNKHRKEDNEKDGEEKKDTKEEIDAEDEEKVRESMSKGAVLHISGMSQETEREEVRALFLKHGDVSWVDFDKGVTEGYIRLKEANSAQRCLESLNKLEGGIILHGASVFVRVVEGDEELQYWQKMYRDIAERRFMKREGLLKHRAGKNRRGRGGFQGRGGRRHGGRDGPNPSKVRRMH